MSVTVIARQISDIFGDSVNMFISPHLGI